MIGKLLALFSAICSGAFVATFAYVHVVRRDLNPMQRSLSTYLTDHTRKLLAVGYTLLSVALVLQGIATALAASRDAAIGISAATCIAAGIMLAPVALTSRRSATGDELRPQFSILAHRCSSWAAFLLAIASMTCATLRSWEQSAQSRFMLGIMTGCAIALFGAVMRGPGACYGLWQKLLVIDIVAWLCFEAATVLTSG